eukprot:CAMPEP_0174854924 /NCGR_PEP_ID=MMETSP1114-20130205/32019_1 /TAXON_ID=312471 /ORGANISM="Neobodo designis, Strain CCAP 1951/1" /LENGTH=371 /DNA_ID=CAMNT_0016089633 /DNA_START=152 /DNA_END=1267 /DNA_ORIENTATION=+
MVGCPDNAHMPGEPPSGSAPRTYTAWELNSLAVVLLAALFVATITVLTGFIAMRRRLRRLQRAGYGSQSMRESFLPAAPGPIRAAGACDAYDVNADASYELCANGTVVRVPVSGYDDRAYSDVSEDDGDGAATDGQTKPLKQSPGRGGRGDGAVRLPMMSLDTLPSDREGRGWLIGASHHSAGRSRRRRGPFSQTTIASDARFHSRTTLSDPASGNTTFAGPSVPLSSRPPAPALPKPSGPRPVDPVQAAVAKAANTRGPFGAAAALPLSASKAAVPPATSEQSPPQRSPAAQHAAPLPAAVSIGVSDSTNADGDTLGTNDEPSAEAERICNPILAVRKIPSSVWDDATDDSEDFEDRSTLSGGTASSHRD